VRLCLQQELSLSARWRQRLKRQETSVCFFAPDPFTSPATVTMRLRLSLSLLYLLFCILPPSSSSSIITCTNVFTGGLSLTMNRRPRHSSLDKQEHLINLDQHDRLFTSPYHKYDCPSFTFEMCQSDQQTGVGCECRPIITLSPPLISPFSVGHSYVGYPSAASYGNSMVTLYTGRIKSSAEPDKCVSASNIKGSSRFAEVKLSKCSQR
jgi:hypothetical protein